MVVWGAGFSPGYRAGRDAKGAGRGRWVKPVALTVEPLTRVAEGLRADERAVHWTAAIGRLPVGGLGRAPARRAAAVTGERSWTARPR